jgi:molybdopterin/thiamine biosynthesis adenylyltransferase
METLATTRTRRVGVLITRQAWETTLRTLLLEPGRFAVGEVEWRKEGPADEVLCRSLEVVDQLPDGLARPPLQDWIAVVIARDDAQTADQWAQRFRPRRSQRLVVLMLSEADRSRWDAVVRDRNHLGDVETLSVVGSGGFVVGREEQPLRRSGAPVPARSSRTAGALGEGVFRRVRTSCVTLIGAGRLGCVTAFQLVGLGVPRLRVIDPDVLELANLDAMPGLTVRDVGRPKAMALAKQLLAFQPDLLVACSQRSAIDPEAQRLMRRRSDLLITCVDDDAPRLCASRIAKQTLTVHLDIATQVTRRAGESAEIQADIRLLTPDRDGGCVACVGGLADVEETLYQIGAPPDALRRGEPVAWHQQRAGSLVTINSIAAGVAVQTWIDLLAADLRTSYWHRLRWRPAAPLEAVGSPVSAEPDCRFCGLSTD